MDAGAAGEDSALRFLAEVRAGGIVVSCSSDRVVAREGGDERRGWMDCSHLLD